MFIQAVSDLIYYDNLCKICIMLYNEQIVLEQIPAESGCFASVTNNTVQIKSQFRK